MADLEKLKAELTEAAAEMLLDSGYTLAAKTLAARIVAHQSYAILAALSSARLQRRTERDASLERDDVPWRVGRKVGRTIYQVSGSEPSDADELIGVMDTPELAEKAVAGHNYLLGYLLAARGVSRQEKIEAHVDGWDESEGLICAMCEGPGKRRLAGVLCDPCQVEFTAWKAAKKEAQ